MKKSDVVVQVMRIRSGNKVTEQQVRNELSVFLAERALKVDEWDQTIEASIGNAMVKNLTSVRSDLSLDKVVRDIDLIMKRIS